MEIQIDEEFKSLIPPLTTVEFAQLEDNIQREGCRDALVIWKGTGILVDGHNRYEICERDEIDFKTIQVPFESREKAIDWICMNQLGRRNLTPADASELRGRMYNSRKKEKGSVNQHTVAKVQNEPLQTTAEVIAKETGVSPATVKRDGQYAEGVEKVAEIVSDVRAKVRAGKVSKGDVIAAAKVVEINPEEAKKLLAGEKSKPAAAKPAPKVTKESTKAAKLLAEITPARRASMVAIISEEMKIWPASLITELGLMLRDVVHEQLQLIARNEKPARHVGT